MRWLDRLKSDMYVFASMASTMQLLDDKTLLQDESFSNVAHALSIGLSTLSTLT